MDEEETQVKTKYDDYLKEMPSEVQDFMWSDLYDIIIKAIQETLSLTDEQTAWVKASGYDLLMQVKSMNDVAKEFKDKGMNEELILKILYLLDSEVLTRAENITEFFTETDEDVSSNPVFQAPSPSELLERFKEGAVKPTVFAPTKHEPVVAPIEPTPASVPPPLSTNTPAPQPILDPYRELPEGK